MTISRVKRDNKANVNVQDINDKKLNYNIRKKNQILMNFFLNR